MILHLDYYDEKDDISGDKYQKLINVCFKYARYFSLILSYDSYDESIIRKYKYISKKLEPYLFVSLRPNICPIGIMSNGEYIYNVYYCCDETKEILSEECDSLYSWWEGRPENLTFYYEDKKVLLCTLTHECECTLSCSMDAYRDFKEFGRWNCERIDEYIEDIYF